MSKQENQIRGWKAKKEGKNWENVFENFCALQQVSCVRIPDGCRSLGKFRLVRVKSPFDYVLGYADKIACVDLKSFGKGNTITYSQMHPEQLLKLNTIGLHGIAGYVIYHREPDKVVFHDAHALIGVLPGGGLPWEIGLLLGSFFDFDIRKIFF